MAILAMYPGRRCRLLKYLGVPCSFTRPNVQAHDSEGIPATRGNRRSQVCFSYRHDRG